MESVIRAKLVVCLQWSVFWRRDPTSTVLLSGDCDATLAGGDCDSSMSCSVSALLSPCDSFLSLCFCCSVSAMASSQPPTSQSPLVKLKPVGDNLDMAWEWNYLMDANNKKAVTCEFCKKTSTGGISRAKRHQLGIKGDVGACRKIPPEIKQKIQEAYDAKKAVNDAFMSEVNIDEEEDAAMQEIFNIRAGKRPATAGIVAARANTKGPLDVLMFKTPKVTQKATVAMARRQTSIKDAYVKDAREKAIQYIARFIYRNGIAFNVVRSKSFKLMLEAVGNYGAHLKPPSYHEIRVPLLKKELELTKEMLKGYERERVEYGCSIMSDAWTDTKGRTLINFLVNSPSGTMFVKSVDGSESLSIQRRG